MAASGHLMEDAPMQSGKEANKIGGCDMQMTDVLQCTA